MTPEDEHFIRYVTLHPGVWPYVADPDTSPNIEIPSGRYFILKRNGIKSGYVMFLQEEGFISAHIAVLPEHRGKWLIGAVRACLEQVGGKIKARVRHRRVYALAVRVGFRKTGEDAGVWTDMELAR